MSRRRKLSADENAIWSAVKRTVKPLHGRRLIQDVDFEKALESATPPKTQNSARTVKNPQSTLSYSPTVSALKHVGTKPQLDKPVHRRLSKGRVPIDARIDLHDMTQAVAHHRLIGFLTDAHASGHRHVLVITGKGSNPASEGILRRMVPIWLNTEPMKHHVSGFSVSSRHHGGEGALYVRLKRNDRAR